MAATRNSIPSSARLVGFAAAIKHRSFTRAAEALGMTQAAISRQILELEEELDVRLFERTSRAVVPTTTALQLADAVLPSLEAIGAAVDEIRAAKRQQKLLTVYTDHSIASSYLLPKITAFETEHPKVRVRVLSSNVPPETSDERFDLAVQHGYPSGSMFESSQIAPETIYPVVSSMIIDKLPEKFSLETLATFPLLEFTQPSKRWIDWSGFFAQFGLNIRIIPRAQFDSYPVALNAALSGQGFLLGWDIPVADHLKQGTLIRIGEWSVEEPGGLRVYRQTNHKASSLLDKLESWLKE